MASTPKGDIPGARDHAPSILNTALASDGANGLIAPIGPIAHNARIQKAWWTPTGGDQGANAASYRRLTVVNGGPSGTGTVVVASVALSASHASLVPVALTTVSSASVASGSVLYFSQDTVGGAHATGTVLRAGSLALAYEVI